MREWRDIVQEAVNAEVVKRGGSVPGAVLKVAVERLADRELPAVRFADFLKEFSDIISVIPRKGQDMLVIPKGDMRLLSKSNGIINIRHDMHKAFSQIDEGKNAYYNKESKYVEWFSANEKPFGSKFVPIPHRTEEAEIKIRQQFANTFTDTNTSQQLISTLSTSRNTLGAFSAKLRELNLFNDWLIYRSNELLERIRQWAGENFIYWDDSWIQAHEEEFSLTTRAEFEGDKFISALASLNVEDLSRIVVPMDIVLKLVKML